MQGRCSLQPGSASLGVRWDIASNTASGRKGRNAGGCLPIDSLFPASAQEAWCNGRSTPLAVGSPILVSTTFPRAIGKRLQVPGFSDSGGNTRMVGRGVSVGRRNSRAADGIQLVVWL